jgi:hypothetical protein
MRENLRVLNLRRVKAKSAFPIGNIRRLVDGDE